MSNPNDTQDQVSPDRSQIKSRTRVRGLAEVYTHEREVNAMLDLVPDMFPSANDPRNTDCTFLEPACGSGNFLVEILRRKLQYVTCRRYGRTERFEHRVLRSLASIYGIDISRENVDEARDRMRAVIASHLDSHLDARDGSPAFSEAVEATLETNIIVADTLNDAADIELVEYRAAKAGTFVREWFRLDPAANQPNLFSQSLRRDEAPVHYSMLKATPEPLVLKEAA